MVRSEIGILCFPTTDRWFHQIQAVHSFMPTSLSGRIKWTSPLHDVVAPGACSTKGGIHSSCIACGKTKPPPWDIEEIRDIDKEVRDVPRTR
jgi:hypothetical protein